MPLDLPFPFTLPRLFRSLAISNFFDFPWDFEIAGFDCSLKRTGKLLKEQMLPGPGVFLQSSGSIWTALTEKGVAESSAQW